MAKKTKPTNMFSAVLPCGGAEKKNSVVVSDTTDNSEELDKLRTQNVELEKKCGYLEEKLSEYIDEIDKLKKQQKTGVKASSADGKNKAEITRLTREVESLQNSNDEYLMKISDLTFENANLKSQFEEMRAYFQKMTRNIQEQAKQPRTQAKPNVYPRRPKTNGYSDWN